MQEVLCSKEESKVTRVHWLQKAYQHSIGQLWRSTTAMSPNAGPMTRCSL